MSAILGWIGGYWPAVGAGLAAVAAFIYGLLVKRKAAADVANAQAIKERIRADVLEGNAKASQKAADVAAAAGQASVEVKRTPASDLDKLAEQLGVLRK